MNHAERYNIVPVINQLTIAGQVNRHGQLIMDHYLGVVGEVVAVPVMTGALFFAADILRFIKRPIRVEPVRVSTYKAEQKAVAPPKCHDDLSFANGRHILLIEDILDTGATLAHLVSEFRKAGALSVEVCVCVRKKGTQTAFLEEPKWVLFNVDPAFVIGYGLDLEHYHRNMSHISAVFPKQKEETGIVKG